MEKSAWVSAGLSHPMAGFYFFIPSAPRENFAPEPLEWQFGSGVTVFSCGEKTKNLTQRRGDAEGMGRMNPGFVEVLVRETE